MKKVTKRQEEVLNFIARYIQVNAYSPTIREIANFFSISVKGAQDHLSALKKKGLVRQEERKPRTIELVNDTEEDLNEYFRSIPILGTVAAGSPTLAIENMDGSIPLHRSLLKDNRDYFALFVRGDSMEEVGIVDGDTAVIEQQNTVNNGEIAVVMLEDSVTLKTFYRESSRIKLKPENSKYSPIYCTNDVRILGKLVYIFRSYR